MTALRWPATILTLLIAASALSACNGHMHERGYMSSAPRIMNGVSPTIIQGRIDATMAAARARG